MDRIFITGATGNVGFELVRILCALTPAPLIIAGVRDISTENHKFKNLEIGLRAFDFEKPKTFSPSLDGCNILFLLRPPHISNVAKFFKPLIRAAKSTGIRHIVFISVQGVQNNSRIPHNKIERLIINSRIPYTFLRPAYFMQNFGTALKQDLVDRRRIFLPAGDVKFTLIDARDVAAVAAHILINPDSHQNVAYDLTGDEKLGFKQMAKLLSAGLHTPIDYESANLFRFIIFKRKQNMPFALIFVIILLHYFPRFQQEPELSDWVTKLSGQKPRTFTAYIEENKKLLLI